MTASLPVYDRPGPFLGGNANPYLYPADPINDMDLNGQWRTPKWVKRAVRAVGHATAVSGRYVAKHVVNWHFAEGLEFGMDSLGMIGFGVFLLTAASLLEVPSFGLSTIGVFGGISAIIGGAGMGYTSYRSFKEAFK